MTSKGRCKGSGTGGSTRAPESPEEQEGVWWLVGRHDGLGDGDRVRGVVVAREAGPSGALARRVAAGGREEWVGPFASYAEARRAWSERAWASVDDATMRWSIVETGESVGPSSD